MAIDAVVFDLDGVLIDSEPIWSEVRRAFVLAHGGRWVPGAQEHMMGMSSMEWARYLHDELQVSLPLDGIVEGVVQLVAARYQGGPPFLPGAVDAVRRLARRWPLGLASSSPRRLIAAVLDASGLTGSFAVTASTEEVAAGKPDPAVYLTVARRLGFPPRNCAAVEDSTNGLRAARAAGMRVIAVPTRSYPPDPSALAAADVVVDTLTALSEELIDPGG